MPKRNKKSRVHEWLLIVCGAACYPVGYNFFFYPNSVVPGGVNKESAWP